MTAAVVRAARLALGLLFTATGIGGFLGLLPLAPPHAFQVILLESGWMRAVKAIELGAGVLLPEFDGQEWPLGIRSDVIAAS